jgi:hypothetical protein
LRFLTVPYFIYKPLNVIFRIYAEIFGCSGKGFLSIGNYGDGNLRRVSVSERRFPSGGVVDYYFTVAALKKNDFIAFF